MAKRLWTSAEVEQLRCLRRRSVPYKELQIILGRSTRAIETKIRKTANIPKKPQTLWTEEDLNLTAFLRQQLNIACWVIGKLLGRSTLSVKEKCRREGIERQTKERPVGSKPPGKATNLRRNLRCPEMKVEVGAASRPQIQPSLGSSS
jgi:hypothetical protein